MTRFAARARLSLRCNDPVEWLTSWLHCKREPGGASTAVYVQRDAKLALWLRALSRERIRA